MITEKLYDKDSHIKAFTAKVIDCRKSENGFEIILDKTAFFPEGGGQYADTGKIGEATVTDVQIINNEIVHYTDKPLSISDEISCETISLQIFTNSAKKGADKVQICIL